MKFAVPQFIDVEDKIFGPLTLKQAIYLAGSIGITVAIYLKFNFFIAIVFGAPFLMLAFLLSFIKVHGRPFVNVLASAVFYALKSKLYLWKKTTPKKVVHKKELEKEKTTRPVSVGLSQSNLKKLAWSLDTNNMFDKKKK